MARRIAKTPDYLVSRCERKKVDMLFAHLKRIMKLDRLRLRALTGATDELTLVATVQNLRRMARLMPHGQPITGRVLLRRAEALEIALRPGQGRSVKR